MAKASNYTASVDDRFEFPDLSSEGLDIISTGEQGHFHILKDHRSYHAEILAFDATAKRCTVKVNGKIHEVAIADAYDLLVKRMGLSANVQHKINVVNAPMPGLVFDILVQPGQEVHRGDPLLILEAMKMENVLKSPGDGVVKRVCVEKGAAVDKGALLVEFE